MEAPVCLIENRKNRLHVSLEALQLLSDIRQPVVVVPIVGLYRTGKSYLMNKLAGKNSARMEAPVCLIENSPDGLHVSEDALQLLSEIRNPVVVVSIVGLYRTGKSYLNRLAGKNSGFSLGSTMEAKMKGIWMWCVPHPDRPNQTLVLLDTEGLGDTEKEVKALLEEGFCKQANQLREEIEQLKTKKEAVDEPIGIKRHVDSLGKKITGVYAAVVNWFKTS